MICPGCGAASTVQRMRCASCGSVFDAADLEQLGQLEYLRMRISEWQNSGIVTHMSGARMLESVAGDVAHLRERLGVETTETADAQAGVSPGPVAAAAAPGPTAPHRYRRIDTPVTTPGPQPEPSLGGSPAAAEPTGVATPSRPSAWKEWLRRGRRQVAAEVALHGLLYFGVLLTFVGTLGFSLFAFGSVNVSLRPVAEVLAPALLFSAAWFLRHHRLQLAAGSLELLAGAVALVSLFTSLNDGAPVPPDLTGPALGVGWALAALLLSAIYGLVVRRRPSSALRFLVTPAAWAALWSLGTVADGGHLNIWQYPLGAAGIVITLAVTRRYPTHVLSRATQSSALVGLPLAYVLVILYAFQAGWPAWPVALTAVALLAGSELVDDSVRNSQYLPLAQAILAAATLTALVPDLGAPRAGLLATGVAIGLLEWQGYRRSSTASSYLAILIGAVGLFVSTPESSAAAVAWGVAALWLHLRTFWLRRTLPVGERSQPWLSAVLAAGFGYYLWLSLSHEPAWLVLAAVLLATALSVSKWPAPQRVAFYGWYLPLAAGLVLVGTAASPSVTGALQSIELTAAAALLAPTLGLSARWRLLRLWGAAIATAWSVHLALQAVHAGPALQALVWVAGGLVAVAAAWQWRERPLSAHLMAAGYLVSALGVGGGAAGPWRLAVLSLFLLASLVGVLGEESGRTSLGWLVTTRSWPARALAQASALLFLTTFPFWVLQLGDLPSIFVQRGRVGVALALVGLCYGVAANRLSARRPLAAIVAAAAVIAGAVGVSVAAGALVPSTVAVAIAIATVVVLGGSLRRPYMSWLAWSLTALLAVLVAHIAGVSTGELPRVLLAWSTLCLVGGLAYDDVRSGRRRGGEGLRQEWLTKPVALGALALPVALSFAFSQPASVYGWWALAAAAIYLITAYQLRAGTISFTSWALVSLAATVLLPWSAWERPELWLPQAAGLALLAFVLSLRTTEKRWWLRWDMAPLAVAHIVALVALTRSTSVGSMAITWTGFGVLSLAVAAWKRHWTWAAAGGALVLIGSNQAGPGWFALSLALTGVALVILGWRATGRLRVAAQWGSAGAAAWAWWELLIWSGWSQSRQLDATLLALAAAAACLTLLVRSGRVAPSWLPAWSTLGAAGLAGCLAASYGGWMPWTFAIALLAFALAGGSLASTIEPALRSLAFVLLFVAGEAAASSAGLSRLSHLSAAVLAGVVALVFACTARQAERLRPWFSALVTFSGLQSLVAVLLAASLWPDRTGLIATLAILGLEAAVLGLTLREASVVAAAPPLLCASWLTFATQGAGGGDVQWITVPIGLAILAVVEIERWPRRSGVHETVPGTVLVPLEVAGMAFVCGVALVESITVGVTYALMLVLWGLLISGWALLTKVRRRLQAGAGVASLGLLLVIAVPLARLVPQITGVALWATLAGLGALFLVVAATLEQSRARVGAALRHLNELTEVWE